MAIGPSAFCLSYSSIYRNQGGVGEVWNKDVFTCAVREPGAGTKSMEPILFASFCFGCVESTWTFDCVCVCGFSWYVFMLGYWENCGSLGRKVMDRECDAVHCCSFSYHIVSSHMYTCSAGHCWFVLFYFAARQIKELDFIVRLAASLLGGAGVREGRNQDGR